MPSLELRFERIDKAINYLSEERNHNALNE